MICMRRVYVTSNRPLNPLGKFKSFMNTDACHESLS
jgi:hypothetical protein